MNMGKAGSSKTGYRFLTEATTLYKFGEDGNTGCMSRLLIYRPSKIEMTFATSHVDDVDKTFHQWYNYSFDESCYYC